MLDMRVIAQVLSIEKHERAKGFTFLFSKALDVLFYFYFEFVYLSIPHHCQSFWFILL
jgi:hypothetical protein